MPKKNCHSQRFQVEFALELVRYEIFEAWSYDVCSDECFISLNDCNYSDCLRPGSPCPSQIIIPPLEQQANSLPVLGYKAEATVSERWKPDALAGQVLVPQIAAQIGAEAGKRPMVAAKADRLNEGAWFPADKSPSSLVSGGGVTENSHVVRVVSGGSW